MTGSRQGGHTIGACPRCARPASTDDRFCGGCGAELTISCASCAAPLPRDGAFCTRCGTPRQQKTEPSGSSASLEDRRRISVLFVDLIDFTPYVERSDPEQVRTLQTGFFAAARDVIGRYGGVVEKFIGDAVMALFGAPVATETDALRCVRAGLELQRVLARFTPEGAAGLRFRVGVSTGEALVDVLAARDGGQAIVAGDVVNTASRMQSVAPPGGVLVCGKTYELTRSGIRYESQPPITLRGRSAPTEVWLAQSAIRRQLPDQQPDPTPLIDRDHELSLLVNALHRAANDDIPQLVTVFGHAGIGKSRLVRELYRHAERVLDTNYTWRTGRCPPFGENVTFAALADIVKAEAGILDTDDASTAEQRLTTAVTALLATDGHDCTHDVASVEATRLIDALRPLVGLPGPKMPAEEAEWGWRRFLLAMAHRQPTVLVLEDLHWADEALLHFVELLGASTRDVPLMLLCTARPELIDREPGWAGTIGGSLTVTLSPLRDTGIASLYASMFGQAVFASDMLRPLVELADGNPLYAQEYVRMLVERGALKQSGRGWTLDTSQELPMPDSVHAVIANRLDLLDPKDRTTLLAAATVGMEFWPGAVAASMGQSVEVVERALRRLEQRDFVYEQVGSSIAGQGTYRFRHVLVRDVCYRRLPRTERMARHERTADWLEALSRSRDSDLAEILARHRWAVYEIAGSLGHDTSKHAPAAREALHRAARRAYSLYATEVAVQHATKALSLYSATDSDQLGRQQLELLNTEMQFYRDGAAFLGRGGEAELTQLATGLYELGDRAGAARAWTLLGQAAWMAADRGGAMARLDRAVELFDTVPDSAEKADAYAELGRLHMLSYEHTPAIACSNAALDILERLGLMEAQANARITVAMARFNSGKPGGLEDVRAAAEFCKQHGLVTLRRAHQNLSVVLREHGEWEESQRVLTEGMPKAKAGQSLTTGYSDEVQRAYFEGDFDRLIKAADSFVDSPAEGWDLQARGLRACLLVLRGSPVPQGEDGDDISRIVAMGAASGFYRIYWTGLAVAGLGRALQGRRREASDLVHELIRSWTPVPAILSGEWITAMAYAAALADPQTAAAVREMTEQTSYRTPWTEAARHIVTGAMSAAVGDHHSAAECYSAAAKIYQGIPDLTARSIALAMATGAYDQAGQDDVASTLRVELAAFAHRNSAPGLLALAAGKHADGSSASAA